jgi:hypothetical protein
LHTVSSYIEPSVPLQQLQHLFEESIADAEADAQSTLKRIFETPFAIHSSDDGTASLPQTDSQAVSSASASSSASIRLIDTAVFRVFQSVHQSILFPAVYLLRTRLFSHSADVGLLRDVRRPDGWTVELLLGKGVITVTHHRCEQNLAPENDASHFGI